jgi:hypothetical protein
MTQQHLTKTRVSVDAMVRPIEKNEVDLTLQPPSSVGEWVEIASDFSPGHCSEGGIGVVLSVEKDFVSVKYVLDHRVERCIVISRVTTIPMPYRGETAVLRQRKSQLPATSVQRQEEFEFRDLNPVKRLQKGLQSRLHSQQVLHRGLS